jgi:hypothetical protein
MSSFPQMLSISGFASPQRAPGQSISSDAMRAPTADWQMPLDDLDGPTSPEAVALMLELGMDGIYRMRFPQIAEQAGQSTRTRSVAR